MKFETFVAGQWAPRYQYKSFEPTPINREWHWEDPSIAVLLEQANRALGELNAFSLIVPDIDLFIQMHVVKEAQTSCVRTQDARRGGFMCLIATLACSQVKENGFFLLCVVIKVNKTTTGAPSSSP